MAFSSPRFVFSSISRSLLVRSPLVFDMEGDLTAEVRICQTVGGNPGIGRLVDNVARRRIQDVRGHRNEIHTVSPKASHSQGFPVIQGLLRLRRFLAIRMHDSW